MYEKLEKLLEDCQFVIDHNTPEDLDKVTELQCNIPYRLLELKEDLLTMFE